MANLRAMAGWMGAAAGVLVAAAAGYQASALWLHGPSPVAHRVVGDGISGPAGNGVGAGR
jgi:hypothetical protein